MHCATFVHLKEDIRELDDFLASKDEELRIAREVAALSKKDEEDTESKLQGDIQPALGGEASPKAFKKAVITMYDKLAKLGLEKAKERPKEQGIL